MKMKENIFENKKLRPLFAIFCAVGWSLAYPLIKLGYGELGIESDDLGSKILFAGVRFFVAGILVYLFCILRKEKLRIQKNSKGILFLVLFAVVNTTLHYMFSYIGLGYLPSSRSTILDSTGGFFLIILSCIIFSDDYFSKKKIIGCILGFSGVVLINIKPGENLFEGISMRGDGMILLNAVCMAFGGILTRIISKKMNMMPATGVSMGIGGAIMIIIALIIKPDNKWILSFEGIVIIVLLILISAVCFGIYNMLLSFHPISKIAIFNAFIPVLGVFFSALILGESMQIQYFVAGVVVALGVYIVNR